MSLWLRSPQRTIQLEIVFFFNWGLHFDLALKFSWSQECATHSYNQIMFPYNLNVKNQKKNQACVTPPFIDPIRIKRCDCAWAPLKVWAKEQWNI